MRTAAITLRQLRYFSKIIETGSITRAAEQLHIAQPALSLNMRQLEAAFHVALLQRHPRGVGPTPAGELLYGRISAMLGLLEQTYLDVSSLGQAATRYLSLGLPPSLVLLVGTEAIVSASQQLPGFSFSLREDPSFALVDAVENRELDVAFAYSVAETSNVRAIPVMSEELLLVTHADQAPPGEVVTLEQVAACTMAFGSKRDVGRLTLEQAANERGLVVDIAYEMRSISGIREIILKGMAASIMPYGAVEREVANGTLAVRRIVEPVLMQTMSIVRPVKGAELPPEVETLVRDYLMALVDLIVARQDGLAARLDAPG